MDILRKIALILIIIGALNWALIGLFNFDVVAQFAGGSEQMLARVIYIVIGVSGLLSLGLLFTHRPDHETVIVTTPEKA